MSETIGSRLKKLRKERGMTGIEASTKIFGYSQASVSAMENRDSINSDQIKAVSKFYDVSCDFIVFGEEHNSKSKIKELQKENDALREKLVAIQKILI